MKWISALLVLLLSSVAAADVIVLQDDTRLEGIAHKSGDDWIIVDAAGHQTTVPAGQVKSFELSRSTSGPEASVERLASLRRSVQNVSDLHQIIDRYNQFITANKDASTTSDAKSDLATWQDRLDKGCIKFGGKWVTPDQASQIAGEEAAVAEKIRGQLEQGRLQEADASVKLALADDPQNPAVLYLDGVLLGTQDKVVPARQAFEQVAAQVANHAPTLNDLAVMMWKQKLYPAAMGKYDLAMQSSPGNKAILDNVAEALDAIPEANKDSPLVKKAAARFADQEAALEKTMEAQQGLYRWGATWVTAKKLQELQDAEAKNKDKIDALKTDYDNTQAAIKQDDSDIQSTNQAMANLASSCIQQNSQGNWVQLPLPPAYYRMQRDVAGYTTAKQTATTHLSALQAQAKTIEQSLPVPKYTGVQHLIGTEGTPIRSDLPAAPTTRP